MTVPMARARSGLCCMTASFLADSEASPVIEAYIFSLSEKVPSPERYSSSVPMKSPGTTNFLSIEIVSNFPSSYI